MKTKKKYTKKQLQEIEENPTHNKEIRQTSHALRYAIKNKLGHPITTDLTRKLEKQLQKEEKEDKKE